MDGFKNFLSRGMKGNWQRNSPARDTKPWSYRGPWLSLENVYVQLLLQRNYKPQSAYIKHTEATDSFHGFCRQMGWMHSIQESQ